MKFPFLATFILFIVLFNIRLRLASRKEEQQDEKFWDRELRSNSVRKKSLDTLEYVHLPYDLLPFGTAGDDENLQAIEDELTALKDLRIVNLTGITNTDLKLEYGTANITALTEYDQNYTSLVIALQKWGDALYTLGRFEDAASVLEFAVKTRTDITATYRLLIDMYKTKLGLNEQEIQRKLDGLVPIANSLNSLSRSTILKLLEPSDNDSDPE